MKKTIFAYLSDFIHRIICLVTGNKDYRYYHFIVANLLKLHNQSDKVDKVKDLEDEGRNLIALRMLISVMKKKLTNMREY